MIFRQTVFDLAFSDCVRVDVFVGHITQIIEFKSVHCSRLFICHIFVLAFIQFPHPPPKH